jgi:hypothetical protein
MIKHLFILAWFTWVVSALGQGQIDLNNRGLAQVVDSTGKPLTGTNFVAVVLYGTSAATLNASFAPAPFRAATTTYPGTWNPAAAGGPGAIATLSGIAPGATVTMRVGVWRPHPPRFSPVSVRCRLKWGFPRFSPIRPWLIRWRSRVACRSFPD